VSEAIRELTSELLVDGATPLEPVISPDGRWVAYTVTTRGATGEPRLRSLWVAPVSTGSPPRRLTDGTARAHSPRWMPDSASIVFLSDGQLHQIGLDGGGAETLTSWGPGISGHVPLADGRTVAIVAPDELDATDERRQAERDDAIVWGERAPVDRLRLLPPGSREPAVVGGIAGRHVVSVAQRPDGGPLAVISWDCPEDEPGAFTARLHMVDPDTGKARDLGPAGLEASSPAWWSAGGRWHVAYLAMTPPGPVGGTAVFDVAVPAADDQPVGDGTPEHRNLTEGMTVCPVELQQVTGGPPLALFAEGLDTALYRLDPDTQRFRRVSGWPGGADSLTASAAGDLVAVLASTAYQPADVHAGPPGGQLRRLSDTRPELRQVRLGTQERLAYTASDGLALDGLLILPPGRGREDGPFPLITLVHGGPYSRFADAFGHWWEPRQLLAAGGYAVFLPNPRGSSGHGHEFAVTVAGAVGTDEWTDILSGIDLLIADGIADPDRLGIGGWSHGGFMAAWAVGQTGRFRAAFMGAGISDWGMQVGVGELGTQEAGLGGGCGWEGPGPHRHDELSPISYASKIRTPVLILHGENDTNVPVGQAVYFQRALARFGVDHQLVIYPREGHGISERNHQLDVLRRIGAWFGRWLDNPS